MFSMALVSLGIFSYPRSPVPVAASSAVEVDQLDDDVADVVPVIPSSTKQCLPVSTSLAFFPDFAASTVAPIVLAHGVAPNNITLVTTYHDVAPVNISLVTAFCNVTLVTVASFTASFDAAPVTASSALLPPIPALPAFPSSPLALSASVL